MTQCIFTYWTDVTENCHKYLSSESLSEIVCELYYCNLYWCSLKGAISCVQMCAWYMTEAYISTVCHRGLPYSFMHQRAYICQV